MAVLRTWSTTAASNNSATPDGWPEGQAANTVNDCAREMMAQIKTWYETAEWIELYSVTYASGTTFTIASTDVTSTFTVGRRVKAVGSGTGTIYGVITASSFATNTTVTVSWDSGSLSNESLTVYVGALNPTNPSIPVIVDTYPIVSGSSDRTKKVRLEADNITTATTRVITVPDSNTTLPIISQVVTLSGPTAARTYTIKDANATIATYGDTAFKVATTTRDISTATGTQAITGIGFTPRGVIIDCFLPADNAQSYGMADAASAYCRYELGDTTNQAFNANLITIGLSATAYQTATLSSFDSDGLTLSWTKTGTPTGTARLNITCFR